MEIDIAVVLLIIAFVLDSLLGDPKWLPHLIVVYGKAIAFGEERLNKKGDQQFQKGAFLTCLLIAWTAAIPFMVFFVFEQLNLAIASHVLSVILLFYCLANRTLIKEGFAVFNALENEGVEAGRKRLSWIVGRDTSKLTPQQIRIATLETMSENLSDGVIAPIFYYLCFGVIGAMVYKMINTLDSMIGYKNERYQDFGKFAARLDDQVNFIPARITAILMLLVTWNLGGLREVWEQGKNHTSPNAGYPEAALAYIISCRFGGPNVYHGKRVNKPYIGVDDREIQHQEIKKVAQINWATSIVFILIGGVVHWSVFTWSTEIWRFLTY